MSVNLNKIVAFHVEFTNKCNARCPKCARTLLGKTHPYIQNNLTEWSLEEIKSLFPPSVVKNKTFTLGGTVDEPMMHSQIQSIIEYLIENDVGLVEIYTNTGSNTKKTWENFGKLSYETKKLKMFFSVDGLEKTNHLYRVNVIWAKVLENMTAYARQNGVCEWQYLVFKHNEQDIENARELAKSLNIPFKVRQNMRNPDPYPAYVYRKIDGQTVLSTHMIEPTYNEKYEHKEISKKRNNQLIELDQDYKSINCVMLHRKEIFIDWNKRLWPCCWFANDNSFGRDANGKDVFSQFEKDFGSEWNSLKKYSIQQILNHEYYQVLLEKSWRIGAKYHTPICFLTCGNQGSRQSYKFTE